MKKLFTLISVLLIVFASNMVGATIIETSVETNAKISYWDDNTDSYIAYAEKSDSDTRYSSSYVSDSDTNTAVSSNLSITDLALNSATLDFEILFDGITTSDGSYSEAYALTANKTRATLTYDAVNDTTLDLDWEFSYSGDNPYGLQIIRVYQNAELQLTLGDVGQVGEYSGTQDFNLLGGEQYIFEVSFTPNVATISDKDGLLSGSFSFDFQDSTVAPVPEPATFILFGSGLAGLAFYRRKRK